MDELKKKFFIPISGFYLGLAYVDEIINDDVIGNEKLHDFLFKENVLTLYAALEKTADDYKQIKFYNEPIVINSCLVVFYKTRPCVLTGKNMSLIQIASLGGSPSAALYHSIHNVFTPLFNKQDKKSLTYGSIQKQLANLQAGLRTNVLSSDLNEPLKTEETLSVIESLDHEVDYWNALSKSSKPKEQVMGVKFREILQPLARDFSVVDALPLTDVEDLLENAHNILDDLWRHEPPYPRIRIQHLMDLIANDIIKCVGKSFSGVNIWSKDFNIVSELLQQCISVLKHWKSSCKQLTEIFWPNYSLHVWSGAGYVPQTLLDLIKRLEEIRNVRVIHRQLVRLLTVLEESDLNTDDMFKPFEDLNVLDCDSYTKPFWKTAIKKYEYLLQPAEQRVAVKLKNQLANITNTRQLLYEFGRYSELIDRQVVKKALQTERQYLLTSLKDYISELAVQLNEETILSSSKYDTPEVVNKIMSTLQLESKANDALKISEKLLDDLQGNEDLLNTTKALLKDTKQQHHELFDWWTREITAKIKDESLSLKETEPVVQFSASKMMRVNYSYRLITLIREVRQLAVLGYHIPNNIEDTCNNAKQFIKHAKILEQIANFHNTIGDRMIPSQRPMMLASAVKLSNLVQEQEVVSWSNVDEVEKYVNNLKNAVEVLSQENNLLAAYHYQINDKIKSLEDIDLIKYYQKWKETTKVISDTIAQVEKKGFKSIQSWKVEIDQQIARVLEIQYLKSLNTLHLYLPEIHADLVYRDSELQFLPNKQILKEKYQQQLKRFLDIPKNFRGVSESATANPFIAMFEKNKEEITKVNGHTEELMGQLDGVVKHWQSWLTLETLDVTQLKTWEHWELHFRASKTFGQEIAKLPSSEERVGSFIIGLSWLRSDLESHNRSYWSQLTLSLKDSIAQDVFKLQQYVDTSTATLNKQPLNLDQIENIDASHADVLRQKPEMEDLYKQMIRKSQMLSSWTRERVDSVNRFQAAWERLQNLLDNYEHIIAKQVETVKSSLSISSENIQNDMERFTAKWEQIKPSLYSAQILGNTLVELRKHLESIKEKRVQLDEIIGRKDKLIQDHKRFNMAEPDFDAFDKAVSDINDEESMWTMFEDFSQDLDKLGSEEWIVFRKKIYRLEEFLSTWQTKLENADSSIMSTRILQEVRKYQIAMPLLKYLRGDDFTDKHWIEVLTLVGIPSKPVDLLCLSDFLAVAEFLPNYSKELQTICKRATSEIVVRQALAELDQWDVQCRFILTEHVDSQKNPITVIKDFKDILYKIGDNQSLLQSVKNSANYDSFAERVELWETRLADLDRYVTSLAQIQRKWIYLEPIFRANTLVQEKVRFDRLDKDFRHLMAYVEKDSRVTTLSRYPSLNNVLENIQDQLSRCQASLDNFLIEKRNKFPRFLFLSDDDLLEVVGQSSKELVIQAHLKKLFAGIQSIRIDSTGKRIVAMCSLEGEVVPLNQPVNINQPVEDWLTSLVGEMQSSLRSLLIECLADGQNADPMKYPSQILCLADSITFTSKTEQSVSNMSLTFLLSNYKTQLNHYSSLEFSKSSENADFGDDDASNLLELKLKCLLLDTIHHIDVIEQLIQANVVNVNDWNWQKQLRYYSDPIGNITVKMVNAELEYSYEYLGNQPKLVRTPLTEKCFLTLTQGMHLGMGGNPYGPAGTGKTESVKALGSLLARQVLVFNCDEGIDAASMSLILSGLVRSGAWGCFDEFNRLDEATLSAVSMYIQPIQNALRLNLDTVTLSEQTMKVNKHCGIFITLNPAGGSYGGRNTLPDSLKQLFRPVVMTHPDHQQIATTLLHCDGFKNVSVIGGKLVEIFSCADKLMSKQIHYDWGLRSLRTVLSGCGKSIRHYRKANPDVDDISLDTELKLVVKSLRIDTLSKLTFADSIKFDALLKDIFPAVSVESVDNELLINALEESCVELKIKVNKRQINKCFKLYEQLKQRMGVAIVGPPNSGKSTLRNLLFNALSKTGKLVKQHVLNPKSMQRSQLLGKINVDTRQWTDGVLTMYSLQVTSEPSDVWSWIVCDGDIDPEWIESLNSVLDDNKMLSLPSGWRIQFGPNVNFIFETHTMSCASPATISRLGIVFLSEEDLDLKDYVENYVATQAESLHSLLSRCTEEYLYQGVDLVVGERPSLSKISIARTALSYFENVSSKTQFTVGLLNGLGGYLDYETRNAFCQQVFEWTQELQPGKVPFYYYNKERDAIDVYTNTISSSANNISETQLPLIVTAQVCHTLSCFKNWLQPGNEQHFLIVGPHGSAKSLILEQIVSERNDLEMITVYCNNNLSPEHISYKLSQSCLVVSSSKGRIYKPKKRHLVLYLKNMHLLKNDGWGTNMLLAFMQQLISYKGFFDHNLEWVGVENVTLVGSAANVTNLSVRFTSSIHLFNIDLPQAEDLNIIFTSYLSSLLNKSSINKPSWSSNKTDKLVTTLIAIYNEISSTFVNVQEQHYNFSPHDLTKWCQAILRYSGESGVDAEHFLLEILSYEALTLFEDRLVSQNEVKRLHDVVNQILKSHWGHGTLLDSLRNVYYVPSPFANNSLLSKQTLDEWTDITKKGIQQYEREGENLNLLIIPELLKLTAKITKQLTEPGGNLLLIGRSGVGRRSAVKIISALYSSKLIIPITTSQPQFNNDLKLAMHQAALDDKDVYLVFQDHILNSQAMVDTLNALLCSSEVPGLYTQAELDTLLLGLKDSASQVNYEGHIFDFFIKQIQKKLHIIVCLEYNHERYNEILENCPALYERCNVIWLSEWSENTMRDFPKLFIEKNSEDKSFKGEPIECRDGFSEIHSVVKPEIASPSRFISLIQTYINIYREKRSVISSRQAKLQGGVSKLTEARNVVAELKIKASEQQEQLEEKQAKANSALDMITNTMKNANTQKQEMEVLKQRTEQETILIEKRKQEIETELLEVKPLIESAQAAVGNIKSEALSEIRSLRAPPDVIRDILEGVLRLMGTQDTSWNSMKNFLSKRGVKDDIRTFDAGRIRLENRQSVERLISNRTDSFDPKNAKRASAAAAPLAAWVIANVRYSSVLDRIKPLEREQNKLKENLTNAELQIEELSTGLTDVNTAVAKLKQQLNTYTKEAAEIEIRLTAAQDVLATAEQLVAKLNDEYERWQVQLKDLSEELQILPGNCLLAAAFITYLSRESEDDRAKLFNQWIEVLSKREPVQEFKLEQFLSTERQQLQWQTEGLSSDQLSLQNAVIILKGTTYPLLLDPTSTASNWIKTHFRDKVIEVVSQSAFKFNTTIELAIRFGKTLIIEEVETVSPILFSILRNQVVYQSERKLININGKLVDFHNNFQLFLCSRNSDLKISSDVESFINTINFVTSRTGLSEQLLTSAIKQESPKLEERRLELIKQREELQEKEHNLQNQLLEDLANSSGDILQNKSLMNSLNETKASANAISQALTESIEVHEKLKKEYNVYKDISVFGSSLYFAASKFSNINVLYSLSITAFVRLFLKSLSSYENAGSNFEILQKSLIQTVYTFMSRGIYKKDRLTFALHLCHNLLPRYIRSDEWKVFTGESFISSKDKSLESIPAWIPDSVAQNVSLLQANLINLYNCLQLNNASTWKSFLEKTNCETNFPSHCQLSEFQKVLLVQALRPDRLRSALLQCILYLTGLRSLNPNVLQLSNILKESLSSEPILLLTVSGIDPSGEIKDVAQTKVGEGRYVEIAMGEGQESKALSALNEASKLGQWLVLRNLHLVTSLLPVLFQNFQTLQHHRDFRLWLVTASHPMFSSVLAQNSLKIAYEIPQGIRNNLLHTYSSWGSPYVEKLNPTGSRLFFVLACVHALLQERRNYIPQGWSKFYEFSNSDLWSAIKLNVELYQTQTTQVQWKFLIGLCLDAIYGGRIDNIQDLVIMESYFRQYFKDEVLSHRWKPFDSNVSLPTYSNYEEYLNVIKQMPDRDLPSYFGLPENIDCAWEKTMAMEVISTLRNLAYVKNKPLAFNREEWQKKLTPFMGLWKKLNQGHDYVRMVVPQPKPNSSSVITFLLEEYSEAIALIQQIHKSFSLINKIVKGNIRPEESDLQLGNALICHETPKAWQKLWTGENDPTKYLTSVINKANGVSKFKSLDSLSSLLKSHISLALLYHPETFLIALKQDISRKSGVPIDELVLQTSWKPIENDNFIILSGLLLEGAIFDGYSLSSCLPNSDSISAVPDCYVHWILKQNLIETGKTIDVPLYRSGDRAEVLIYVQVSSNFREKDKWIKTGLAFFITY